MRFIKTLNNQYSADFLFSSGWTSEDKDMLIDEYGLTDKEAADLCEEIRELELNKKWEAIASYMDDDIREDVHGDLAPCTRDEFLAEYLKRDPDFQTLLDQEFNGGWR